jgi:hypothetical protein
MLKTAFAEIFATPFEEPVSLTPVLQFAFDQFSELASVAPEGFISGAEWNVRLKKAKVASGASAPSRASLSRWRSDLVAAGLIEEVKTDCWRLRL